MLHLGSAQDEAREHEEPGHPGEAPVTGVPERSSQGAGWARLRLRDQSQQPAATTTSIILSRLHVQRMTPSVQVAHDDVQGCQVAGQAKGVAVSLRHPKDHVAAAARQHRLRARRDL